MAAKKAKLVFLSVCGQCQHPRPLVDVGGTACQEGANDYTIREVGSE